MQPHIVLKPSTNVSVTVSTTGVALPAPPTDVVGAILEIEDADVRMRYDGVTLTAAPPAMKMVQNSVWEITGRDILTAMRFIRAGATDAVVVSAYIKGE